MTAPLAQSAPYNDFQLLKALLDYSTINLAVSKAASEKFAKHLWYLSEYLVALAFFDSQVPLSMKRLMITAIREGGDDRDPPKHIVALKSFREKKFDDFVTKKSIVVERMELLDGFLQVDPEMWDDRDFQQAMATVRAMSVVNDQAERGVALIQEFSGLLTRNEPQLQFLMQVVEEHR